MGPRKVQRMMPVGTLVVIAVPILTFVGGMFMNAWSIAGNIATKTDLAALKSEVTDGFKKTDEAIAKTIEVSRKYTEDKMLQVRDEAFNHSDMNKKSMDSVYAELNAKVTLMLGMLQDQAIERNRKR